MGGAGRIGTGEVMVKLQGSMKQHLVTLWLDKKKPSKAFYCSAFKGNYKIFLVIQGKSKAESQK